MHFRGLTPSFPLSEGQRSLTYLVSDSNKTRDNHVGTHIPTSD
nr:MAG TPA: hypothetical protein [Caudoviricetes sp.]